MWTLKRQCFETDSSIVLQEKEGRSICFSRCPSGSADKQQQVICPSPVVSRTHSLLEFRNGSWFICDLDSRNGTFVNGRMIAKPKKPERGYPNWVELAENDLIGLGVPSVENNDDTGRDLEQFFVFKLLRLSPNASTGHDEPKKALVQDSKPTAKSGSETSAVPEELHSDINDVTATIQAPVTRSAVAKFRKLRFQLPQRDTKVQSPKSSQIKRPPVRKTMRTNLKINSKSASIKRKVSDAATDDCRPEKRPKCDEDEEDDIKATQPMTSGAKPSSNLLADGPDITKTNSDAEGQIHCKHALYVEANDQHDDTVKEDNNLKMSSTDTNNNLSNAAAAPPVPTRIICRDINNNSPAQEVSSDNTKSEELDRTLPIEKSSLSDPDTSVEVSDETSAPNVRPETRSQGALLNESSVLEEQTCFTMPVATVKKTTLEAAAKGSLKIRPLSELVMESPEDEEKTKKMKPAPLPKLLEIVADHMKATGEFFISDLEQISRRFLENSTQLQDGTYESKFVVDRVAKELKHVTNRAITSLQDLKTKMEFEIAQHQARSTNFSVARSPPPKLSRIIHKDKTGFQTSIPWFPRIQNIRVVSNGAFSERPGHSGLSETENQSEKGSNIPANKEAGDRESAGKPREGSKKASGEDERTEEGNSTDMDAEPYGQAVVHVSGQIDLKPIIGTTSGRVAPDRRQLATKSTSRDDGQSGTNNEGIEGNTADATPPASEAQSAVNEASDSKKLTTGTPDAPGSNLRSALFNSSGVRGTESVKAKTQLKVRKQRSTSSQREMGERDGKSARAREANMNMSLVAQIKAEPEDEDDGIAKRVKTEHKRSATRQDHPLWQYPLLGRGSRAKKVKMDDNSPSFEVCDAHDVSA